LFRRRLKGLHDAQVLGMAGRALIASLVMGVAVWLVAQALNNLPAWVVLVVGGIVGVAVFEGVALLIGLPEARSVPLAIIRRFRRG
jgi:Na+/H+ antiporter NhaC